MRIKNLLLAMSFMLLAVAFTGCKSDDEPTVKNENFVTINGEKWYYYVSSVPSTYYQGDNDSPVTFISLFLAKSADDAHPLVSISEEPFIELRYYYTGDPSSLRAAHDITAVTRPYLFSYTESVYSSIAPMQYNNFTDIKGKIEVAGVNSDVISLKLDNYSMVASCIMGDSAPTSHKTYNIDGTIKIFPDPSQK